MSRIHDTAVLVEAAEVLYRWPPGYGSIVGRLHIHSDHGCADGVMAVEEGGDIEVDVSTAPSDYTHMAAAKDLALAVNLCADRDHPFRIPDAGEVRGGESTILGRVFYVVTADSVVEVRVRHGHISTVTEPTGDLTITHSALSCVQPKTQPDSVVFTNISRTVRARGAGRIDAHQAVSINYAYMDELAVPVGVRVITHDTEGIHAWEAMWLEPNNLEIPDHAGELICE